MATIHLLNEFVRGVDSPRPVDKESLPKVFLSDLPDVIPLCRRSVQRWRDQYDMRAGVSQVEVDVMPLTWGDLEMGGQLARQLALEKRFLTHVLLIDLVSSLEAVPCIYPARGLIPGHRQVYFPHLYPSLLRSLLQVTMPPFCKTLESTEDAVGGPEVILSCEYDSVFTLFFKLRQ
jgi:hypothetical protein